MLAAKHQVATVWF